MDSFHDRRRIALSEALKRYWPWLSGVVVYPVILFMGPNHKTYPQWISGAMFFAAFLFAMWPWFGKDAPKSFWYVAVALFFVTGILCAVVSLPSG
jgi:hypothetical protein